MAFRRRGKFTRKRTYKKRSYRRRRYTKRKSRIPRRKVRKYRRLKRKSSVYKKKNVEGLKNQITCDISHFMELQAPDIWSLIISTLWDTGNDLGLGYVYTNTFLETCREVMGRTFNIYSTDLMNEAHQRNVVSYKRNLCWKAFNPTLSNLTCGSKFVDYVNSHKFIKYVGIKISWKPTIKNSFGQYLNFVTPDHQIAGQMTENAFTGTVAEHEIHQDYDPYLLETDRPAPDYAPAGGICQIDRNYNRWQSNPQFRFWVNFDKQGYTNLGFPQRIVRAATDASNEVNKFASRWYFRECFDQYGQKTWDSTLVKNYDMSKPFKFFVRPMVQDTIEEPVSGDGGWKSNDRDYTNAYEQSMHAWQNQGVQDQQITQLKKVPWMQTSRYYPIFPNLINGPPPAVSDYNGRQRGFFCYCNDRFFFNPILFGWLITCDNIQHNEKIIGIVPTDRLLSNEKPDASVGRFQEFDIDTKGPLNDLGQFKVTFYTKFKKEVQYVNVQVPDNSQI